MGKRLVATIAAAGAALALGSTAAGAERPLPIDAFNRTVAQAAAHGRAWVRSPLQATIHFLRDPGTAAGKMLSITISYPTGEAPRGFGTVARATVTNDGLPDDSVRSTRHRLVLVYRRPGMWTLRSAAQSWRCWPGRGHQGYSTGLCV
jgi:hypothetical protein